LALAVCERYLEAMPLSLELRQKLLSYLTNRDAGDPPAAMAELHRVLAGDHVEQPIPACASVAQRLALAYGSAVMDSTQEERADANRILAPAPPIQRSSMAPGPWPPRPLQGLLGAIRNRLQLGHASSRHAGKPVLPDSPDPQGHWHRAGSLRRSILLFLVLLQTALATQYMSAVLPYQGTQPLEIALLVLFALLCGWVSAGFWTAIMGFLLLQFGGDRYAISASAANHEPIPEQARIAVVMPICNEHVARVFAGLRATYESLARSGNLQHFDFYVLSDSSDPDTRVAENEAWLDLCRRLGCFGRVFYRWRQHRIKRKSGNIADFCRRWGSQYRYMIVLDADSVMTGACLSRLVQLMEANPSAGIIQTAPHAVGRDTFYARLQQFANRVYGPLFVTGLHFWQLGESHYWGHNAIIRIDPFMRHCALGRLPGTGSLSGEILSHDFVEAALMRRAGWAVWIAYDLPGSYEEMPPNQVDELQRDRRWCHGNLMNFRLFLAQGFHIAHRAVFVTGMIAYVSAFFWFLFLLLSTWMLAQHTLVEPEYFTQPRQLFPLWPAWHPDRAVALFSVTATWLFLPKLLSVALIVAQGAKQFGGVTKMLLSMFAEWLFSMLLAPIRMLFHTQFVIAALIGWRIQWQSPQREDASTSWETALRRHGWHTLLGIVWAGGVLWLNPSYLLWLLPIVGALMLSIPLSVYSSSAQLGRQARRLGLFLIPEESTPPVELQQLAQEMEQPPLSRSFVEAVTDPTLNALLCALGAVRRSMPPVLRQHRIKLVDNALRNGPGALSNGEKMTLLSDAQALAQLHFMVWSTPEAHSDWFPRQQPAARRESRVTPFVQAAYVG
jgi:membrane glycosyltransferase